MKPNALLIALSALAFAGTAAAQGAAPSSLTREQVRAEAIAALKAGRISYGLVVVDTPQPSGARALSRAEVHAAAVAANQAGQIAYGLNAPAPQPEAAAAPRLTRAQVHADTLAANRAGRIPQGPY